MDRYKIFASVALAGATLLLAGCGKKPAEPTPVPTSTVDRSVVPPKVAGSRTQIAFRRDSVAVTPFADFLLRTQADARTYWRRDASLRQVDVEYDPTTDQLGYQMRLVSPSKLVSNNPDTLTVYYNYEMPLVEEVTQRYHQPKLDSTTHLLVGLTCEEDGPCNATSYAGRAPLPTNAIQLSFPQAYSLVADKIKSLNVGTPPFHYSLQVEAGEPQWIFYNWRVQATTGTVTSLSTL
jgi:hypothetical protein